MGTPVKPISGWPVALDAEIVERAELSVAAEKQEAGSAQATGQHPAAGEVFEDLAERGVRRFVRDFIVVVKSHVEPSS